MKINNPTVTLKGEAKTGIKKSDKNGFLGWLFISVVKGDDGEFYEVGASILSTNTENLDLVTMTLSKGKGQSTQHPDSIYRVDHYPGAMLSENARHAGGSVKIKDKGDSILASYGLNCAIECFADHSWHVIADSCDGDLHIDVWYRPHGYPLWHGREKPSAPTRHSITYGHNWA